MQTNLTDLTEKANDSEATYVTLNSLKKCLEQAEALKIPSEQLKDSYQSVEQLTVLYDDVNKL